MTKVKCWGLVNRIRRRRSIFRKPFGPGGIGIRAICLQLLHRQRVWRRADAAWDVEGRRSEEEVVAPVGGAIFGETFKVPHFADRHSEERQHMEVEKVGVSLALGKVFQR